MEADEPALGQVPGDHYPAHRAAGAGDGWTKHTIITMLSRLEKKGAVAHGKTDGPRNSGRCWIRRMPAARETRSFLDRLYGGSLGLMVSTLVGTEALTPDDVEELEELLQGAKEAKRHDESQ